MAILIGDSTNNTLPGTNSADLIVGGSGDDTLSGGNGNDLLFGGSGDDSIDGGNGNDLLFGGSGEDAIDGGNGNDFVDGGSGDDVINGGNGNDLLYGDSGNDVIDGGNGGDLIFGGSGNDVLIGVGGADWIQGGSGNDLFSYQSELDSNASAWDRIIDFTQGQDKIDLSDLLGPTTDLAWGNKTATANGAWYLNSGSSTFVFADINNDGKADLKIELKNACNLTLTANDFLGVGMTPVASDGAAQGDEDTALTGTLKATDPDGGTLKYVLDQGPAHGTLELDAVSGAFIYKADANYNGSDFFTYKVNDGSSDSNVATVNLTVNAVNDAAAISGVSSGDVAEDGAASVGDKLNVADVDTGEAVFQAVAPESLKGTYGNFTFNELTGEWAYSLDQSKADSLKQDQQVTDALKVVSLDGTASETIKVNITGTNDAATILGSANGKVTEDATRLDDFGSLNLKDVDTGEAVFQTPSSLAGIYGDFTFDSASGAWTYTLNNGADNVQALNGKATVQDSLTVTSLDGTASETIKVDISGANDDATITGSASGAVAEAGGVMNGTLGTPSASGDLDVSDADAGEAVFQAVASASLAGTYGDFTFDELTGEWTYALDQGKADLLAEAQNAIDELTVNSLDGTASQTIKVNITGANDAPVADVDDGDASAGGNVLTNDTDPDAGDKPNLKVATFGAAVVDGDAFVPGAFGSVLIDNDGNWAYTFDDGNPYTTPPGPGLAASETFNYTIVDALGATSSSTLTINIAATDDSSEGFTSSTAAAITPAETIVDNTNSGGGGGNGGSNALLAVADEATAQASGASGNVLDNDEALYTGDSLIVTAVNGELVDGDLFANGIYGSLMMSEAGDWSYFLNDAGADALAQDAGVEDVFGYTMADGGETASSTLTIHIGDFIL